MLILEGASARRVIGSQGDGASHTMAAVTTAQRAGEITQLRAPSGSWPDHRGAGRRAWMGEQDSAWEAARSRIALLESWLTSRSDAGARAWLSERSGVLAKGAPRRKLFMAFSGAVRRFPKAALALEKVEARAAEVARPGWRPELWSAVDAARAILLLSTARGGAAELRELLDALCASADLGELVSIYRSLPILPFAAAHEARCAEGIRTNMSSVFEAVAHENPYPAERLAEGAWNQMVLKALFCELQLAPIQGLEERANEALANMLVDYARERWAAARRVSPELWRCVAARPTKGAIAGLERALGGPDPRERRGAALALRGRTAASLAKLAARYPIPLDEGLGWLELAEEP